LFRRFLKGLLYFVAGILAIELLLLFLSPVYDFTQPQPFSGEKIFNPYEHMDSLAWKKTNFHFHTRAWFGLTSGRNNSPEVFWTTYKKLGYEVPCISDYMRINPFNKDSVFYIPVYEHGYGIRKKHHILIGAKKVLWFDYSLYQNIHNKQHILNLLGGQNEIVAIAHPDWESGFTADDMRYLSNYDLLEVLDNNWRSVPLWDAALSSGHPVYILADDDAHDISDPFEIGRCATFINSPTRDATSMMRSLKEGNAYGVDLFMADHYDFTEKEKDPASLAYPVSIRVKHDTLFIAMSDTVMRVKFIGQNGKCRKYAFFTKNAWYRLQPEDTYIRTEIIAYNRYRYFGSEIYLNPVYRYGEVRPDNSLKAEINWPRTWIFRICSIPSLIALIVFFFYRRKKRSAEQRSP
jgi:hypothetical protein